MKTAVGQGETIAVAYDPGSGTVYYSGDRPGAIYRQTNPYTGVLVAGMPGGSLADGIPAVQAAVCPGRNGLAVDAGGNLFLSEPALHRIRRIDAQTGLITTIAGTGGDVPIDSKFFEGNNAIFNNLAAPGALAFNPLTGDLFVADETLDIIYRITGNGSPITSSNGFMYRSVGGNPTNTSIYVEFEWYNPFGYAGDNGSAKDAKLNHPRGLAFDNSGDLYIADTGNNVVRRVDASSNVITTVAGNGVPGFAGDGGLAASAELFMPTGVGVLEDRTLYIADTSNHRVRAYDLPSGEISTFAGDGVARFTDNSYAFPTGIAAGSGLTFFVVDSQNRSLAETDLTSDGALKVEVAHIGDPSDPGYVGDGAPGGDAVNQPMAVVFDKNGNVFFSDSGNSRVRRVDAATNAVTTVVGNGIPGYDGDNGDALHARLNCPAGLAFGAAGDLFVSDTCANVVRHVSPGADGLITGALDEIITTSAGTGVRYGTSDGEGHPATAARLNAPGTLAIQNGTLFVGEPNVATIASIAPDGTIHYDLTDIEANAFTVDSQGHFILADAADSRDIQCDGQEIAFIGGSITSWGGAAVDASGRLYLTANAPGQVVYRFQAHGGGSFCSASSGGTDQLALAGTGAVGYSGDNGPAASATLNQPAGLAVDAGSNIWIADMGNNAIRRVQQPSINVTPSPASIDFGTHAVQTTSTPQSATATSSGTSPATFSATTLAGANPGDFVVVSDGCVGAVIASGAKCQVSVAFTPTAPGSRSAILQFNDNATGSPQTINLTGSGATLDVSPPAIAFDPQTQLIASSAIQVTVTNHGTSAVSILSLSFTGQNPGDFSVVGDGCTNVSLNGGGSCTFGAIFTPQGLGSRMATLTITSSASDLMRAVYVSGTGTPPVASAGIAPAIVAFGQAAVGTKSTPASITVTSTGTAPLTIASAALTGNQKTDFILSNDSCSGATLAPSQTCTVSVTFAPVDVCNSTAAVTFTDNASDSPQNVSLTGHGISAGAGSPFHAVTYCTSPAAEPQELAAGPDGNVWFDEHGSIFSPAAIARANAAAGVIKEDPTVVQNQWRPSSLSIASDGSYAYIESRGGGFDEWYDIVNPQGVKIQQPNGFPGPSGVGPDDGFWLTSRSTCADNLLFQHFAPNAGTASVVPDAVWLYYNANHKPCLAPSFVATGPDGLEWIGTSNQGPDVGTNAPNGFVRVTLDNVIADFTPTDAPPVAATVGPDGHMWALVANLGAQACSLEQLTPGVLNAPVAMDPALAVLGCFSIVSGPDHRLWMTGTTFSGTAFVQVIAAYDPASAKWSLYPTPSINSPNVFLTAGPDEGIWFDAIPSGVGRLDIGGGPSAAYVTPTTIGFPSTIVGLPAGGRLVIVRSTGTAPLTIGSVALAGADAGQFLVQDDGCSGAVLSPGQTCTVEVTSRPTKSGSHVAKLVITDDDAFSPQVVRLAEFTLPPGPTVTPGSASFPTAIVGTHGKVVTFTLTNNYDRSLSVGSVSISGANFGDFTMLNNTCQNGAVAADGGTCSIDVRFDPTAAGSRQALLSFSDAATPPTQSVTLAGAGQAAGGGNTGGSSSCACNSTGNFVDPAIVYPAVSNPFAASSTSPSGAYTLEIQSISGKPSAFVITKKGATTPLVTIPAPNPSTTVWPNADQHPWGFSPDDDRFALHYATFGTNGATTTDWIDNIALFDLKSPTPSIAVKTLTLPIAPDGIATGPSGSMAFSPHGAYFLSAQLQSTASDQSISLNVLTSAGASVYQNVWSPASAPADPEDTAGSSFWGFSPDEQTFTYYLQEPGDENFVELIALPTGVRFRELHYENAKALKVQFSPCGEVIAVEHTDITASVDQAEANPANVTLYSARPADAANGAIVDKSDLFTNETIVVAAGPTEYTVAVGDASPVELAPNTSTGSCPAPTTSGDAGGSDAPAAAVAPKFKETFDSNTPPPPRIATLGQQYSYTFEATGSPDPTFAFVTNTCTFLTIDATTGEVSGTPSTAFASCTYSVTAVNGAGNADAGPFTITMATAAPAAAGEGGPSAVDIDVEPAPFAASTSSSRETTSAAPSQQTTLVLPHGRGQIVLNADVTPSVSTFTYTENDLPAGPLGSLLFAGLDFSLTAVDKASGAPVTNFVDPPIGTIVVHQSDLQSARIGDPTTVSVYWWSGSGWVNQMPCAGCRLDTTNSVLTVKLTQPGEYMLAAAQPSQTLTLTAPAVSATAGTPFSGPVASFVPLYPSDLVGFYTATVSWGDGQTSDGPISSSGTGTFVIANAHTWAAAGTYTIGVTVLRGGMSTTTQTTAVVSGVGQPPAFTAANPPLTATVGAAYSYGFAASGVPAPAFALGSGAPSWLTINATSGAISGTPPPGTTSFSYSVVASNGVAPNATAGPFTIAVSPPTNKSADLSLTLTAAAQVTKGSTITYSIVVTNNGPATATNVGLLLLASPELSIVSVSPAPQLNLDGLWSWRLANLAAGQSATFTLRARATNTGIVVAAAAVGSDTKDPKLVNNAAAAVTTVK